MLPARNAVPEVHDQPYLKEQFTRCCFVLFLFRFCFVSGIVQFILFGFMLLFLHFLSEKFIFNLKIRAKSSIIV